MTKRLEGRVALITGAASGIGRCAAHLFAEAGASIALADIDREAGHAAAASISETGGNAVFVWTDIAEESSVEEAVATTVTAFGKLDALYNNAGGTIPGDGAAHSVPIDLFWQSLKRDLFGTFLACRFAIPEIVKAGGGAVVNTASVHGLLGAERPSNICYATAKGGVAAMTRTLAVEYAPKNVRVNAVAPGATRTDRILAHGVDRMAAAMPMMVARHHLGLLDPVDIALAALYLASDEARKVTGLVMPVDSGWTAS